MDSHNSIESDVNIALSCPVCFDQYRDPRTLTCAHTFCQGCIHQHVLKQRDEGNLKEGIECPFCRKITNKSSTECSPDEWSKSLPVNYALQEVIQAQKKEDTCTVCSQKGKHAAATRYCIQCKRKLCIDCKSTHDIFEHLKNHRTIQLDDTEKVNTFPAELDHCGAHGKPIEFYCVDDVKLCCSSCAIIKHRKCHEVVEISEIAEKNNAEKEKSLLTRINKLEKKSSNVHYFFDKKEKELDRQLNDIEENMVNEEERIIKLLKESRARVKKQASDLRQTTTKQYKLYRTHCDDIKCSMSDACRRIDIARQYGTPVQLFIALHEEETQLTKEIAKSGEYFDRVKYLNITSENANTSTYFEDIKQCELKNEEVEIEWSQIPDRRIVKLEKIRSINLKATSENESEPLYTGLDFLLDGRLIAVDNANKKFVVMNEALKIEQIYIHDTVLLDVVSVSMENIYLTTGPHLLTFNVKEDNVYSLTNTIETQKVIDSISEYNGDAFVVGTYESNSPAALMNRKGEIRDFDIHFPEKEWKLGDSFNAYAKDTGVLAITDAIEHKVLIYDTNKKSEKVVQDERIKTPRGISAGLGSSFFVCSHGTGKIVQISEDGIILHEHEIDMRDPYTLCFSKDRTLLAVANYTVGDSKLHIYHVSM